MKPRGPLSLALSMLPLASLVMVPGTLGCGRSPVTLFEDSEDGIQLEDPLPDLPPPVCEEEPCRKLGWSCNPMFPEFCCDGLPCTLQSDAGGWTCGDAAASGDAVPCPEPGSQPGCSWLETMGCDSYGEIAQVCPGGGPPLALRRCSGSCLAPDEYYATFSLCSCDQYEPECDAACSCHGPSWDAAYCCDG